MQRGKTFLNLKTEYQKLFWVSLKLGSLHNQHGTLVSLVINAALEFGGSITSKRALTTSDGARRSGVS